MQRQQPQTALRSAGLRILAAGIACALSACSSAPREVQVTCANSLQRDFTAPFRPGATCLEVTMLGDGQGTAPLRTAMKAVRMDGRVFFVPEQPAALAQAPVAGSQGQP